ncbi:MAG: hypothetical protein QNJ55_08860 [Xenococcus sp. MO_188.B8]|nr:hypothetical protein [Xenococcus sp. MO_188.B8]
MSQILLKTSCATPTELIQYIYDQWRTKTVILVFYHLEKLDKSEPKKLLQQFWHPLVKLIQKHPEDCFSYLVMFFVNHASCSNEWDIQCLETLNTKDINKPIMLEPIKKFPEILIKNWIRQNRLNFPKLISEVAEIDIIAKDIWEDSFEGMPELAIEKICNRCGTSFYDISQLLEI